MWYLQKIQNRSINLFKALNNHMRDSCYCLHVTKQGNKILKIKGLTYSHRASGQCRLDSSQCPCYIVRNGSIEEEIWN